MTTTRFHWAVVGAGPAGIAAVGKLIDAGISPNRILWLDPHFQVGDLGRLWRNVSSNTKVKRFMDFLRGVTSFNYHTVASQFAINTLDPDHTCLLQYIVEPLQWVSNHLRTRVTSHMSQVIAIERQDKRWLLQCSDQTFQVCRVLLATGAMPRQLPYAVPPIPLSVALDKNRLANIIQPEHCYAVFGSSHSAIIVLNHLVDLQVKQIINFYRNPLRYAIESSLGIIHDNTGLKGEAAHWARQYIDTNLPLNLLRLPATSQHCAQWLPQCQQAIYAIGFENKSAIKMVDYCVRNYNATNGVIAPGVFGLGIAYPQLKKDLSGEIEKQVGLWKFLSYLEEILPTWLGL